MKNIWIMNHYATNMFFQQAGRHYSFAKELKKRGYEPTVFAASSKHKGPLTSSGVVDSIELGCKLYTKKMSTHNFPFIFVRTNNYKGNSIGRIFNMIFFSINLFIICLFYARKYPKPDVIYASSVHPLTCVVGILLAKIFSVKCVCEIRDLWPESLIAYGIIKKESLIAKLLYTSEKWIYTKADKIIMTWPGGYQYIKDQGWDKEIPSEKVVHISNGLDLQKFKFDAQVNVINDKDLKNEKFIKIIYTGSLRKVNNLSMIIDVAEILQNKGNNTYLFLIYGNGNEKKDLEKKIISKQLSNIILKGNVEKKYIPSILKQADILLLHNSSTSLDKYGQSQNKFFEYIASQKAILMTYTVGYSICQKYSCGIEIELQNAQNISDAILSINVHQKIINKNLVLQFDYAHLTSILEKTLN